MTKIFNQSSEKPKRKILRINSTSAERLLWARLRGQQLGYKFRRQYSVGPYVIDFYCPQCKLAIEVDGDIHRLAGAQEYNAERQRFIETMGVKFLRFENIAIYTQIEEVIKIILKALQQDISLSD